jgi:hypothetical protein
MKKLIAFVFVLLLTSTIGFSYLLYKEHNSSLYLDLNTTITAIIENEELPLQSQYIRTLKVTYKDFLDKPIKLQNGDKLYNRCSFESQLIMYSESDSLVLDSWKRMSCEITAFFNLTKRDSEWLKYHVVNSITIKNITTNYCKNYKNEQPLFFNNIIKKYNSNTKLD